MGFFFPYLLAFGVSVIGDSALPQVTWQRGATDEIKSITENSIKISPLIVAHDKWACRKANLSLVWTIIIPIFLVHWNKPIVAIPKLIKLDNDYPTDELSPLRHFYGMHVYSKMLLSASKIEYSGRGWLPSMHTLLNVCHPAEYRVSCFLHTCTTVPTEKWRIFRTWMRI